MYIDRDHAADPDLAEDLKVLVVKRCRILPEHSRMHSRNFRKTGSLDLISFFSDIGYCMILSD